MRQQCLNVWLEMTESDQLVKRQQVSDMTTVQVSKKSYEDLVTSTSPS